MLVQHGFGDPGRVGDVVHGRCVVALGGEDVVGGIKQLDAPLVSWQAGSPAADRLLLQLGGHGFTLAVRFSARVRSTPEGKEHAAGFAVWPLDAVFASCGESQGVNVSDLVGQGWSIGGQQVARQVSVFGDSRRGPLRA